MTLDEARATVEMVARVFPDAVEAVAVVAEHFEGGFADEQAALRRFAAHLRVKTMTPAERAEWWRNAVGRPNSAIRRASGD